MNKTVLGRNEVYERKQAAKSLREYYNSTRPQREMAEAERVAIGLVRSRYRLRKTIDVLENQAQQILEDGDFTDLQITLDGMRASLDIARRFGRH